MSVELVVSVGEAHLEQLLRLFSAEWWTRSRSREDVQRMLAATDAIVAAVDVDRDQVIGFARALTDGVFVAVVLDVIVAVDRRGEGVGVMLIDALVRRLAGVNSIELVCQPELEGFYAKWGFTDRVGRSRLMRRTSDPALTD